MEHKHSKKKANKKALQKGYKKGKKKLKKVKVHLKMMKQRIHQVQVNNQCGQVNALSFKRFFQILFSVGVVLEMLTINYFKGMIRMILFQLKFD